MLPFKRLYEMAMRKNLKIPMSQFEIHQLGTYNGEVARGLVHTDEWHKKMKELQERFDEQWTALADLEQQRREREAAEAGGISLRMAGGHVIIPPEEK